MGRDEVLEVFCLRVSAFCLSVTGNSFAAKELDCLIIKIMIIMKSDQAPHLEMNPKRFTMETYNVE